MMNLNLFGIVRDIESNTRQKERDIATAKELLQALRKAIDESGFYEHGGQPVAKPAFGYREVAANATIVDLLNQLANISGSLSAWDRDAIDKMLPVAKHRAEVACAITNLTTPPTTPPSDAD